MDAIPQVAAAPASPAAPAVMADDNIRLVIWDLDETFWHGTLAEGSITPIPAHIELVRQLNERGIVNAICSKNDFARAEAELKRLGIWDEFIFPKIAFEPKGAMVREIIQLAQLRAASVLFLDDNATNLNEALFYNPGLQISEPSMIATLSTDRRCAGKPDPGRQRLARYKVLEQKHQDLSRSGTDNLAFLRASQIRVSLHHDIMSEFPRIHDLVNRTNQLNFTKRRWPEPEDEARAAFAAEMAAIFEAHAGYIKVADRYGNYGICGFYLIHDTKCRHFLFSCRTLNMGIEQFIWHRLGRPKLDIIGEVVSELADAPDWISVVDDADAALPVETARNVKPVLCIRGACDLSMTAHYLRYRFDTIEEFGFPYQGWGIHPVARVVNAADFIATPAGAAFIAQLPGMPPKYFDTVINTRAADVYLLSFSSEVAPSLHRSKSTGLVLPFQHPAMIGRDFADMPYCRVVEHGGADTISPAQWRFMQEEFSFAGYLDEKQLAADIEDIFVRLEGKLVIVLMLNTHVGSALETLDKFARINEVVRPLAMRAGVQMIDMNELVRSADDLVAPDDGGVHYTRDVYLRLARRVEEIITRHESGMAATPPAPPIEIETGNLAVRYYPRDPARLIIAFASAGARRVNGFSEEWHGSFQPTGASLMFVTDKHNNWYNYLETGEVFRQMAAIAASHPHVGVVGESMGGSGAILFTNYAQNIARVLAFTPQYSIFPPFVKFDSRYDYIFQRITAPQFVDYAQSPIKPNILLVYGNTVWRDYIHHGMFETAGFQTLTLDHAKHEMAAYIKSAHGNATLRRIAGLFADFTQPFSKAVLQAALVLPWSDVKLREEHGPSAEFSGFAVFTCNVNNPVPLVPSEWPLLSQGKPATQSSLSEWSLGDSLEGDAAGAVSGEISARASFHTQSEDGAWWAVDLLLPCQVFEIRLFNRLEQYPIARRGYRFKIEGRLPGAAWQTLAVKDDDGYVGGVDGRPYRAVLPSGPLCQEIRVSLLGVGFLHLNQVQVFGLSGNI
jgi:FkbH-like protein